MIREQKDHYDLVMANINIPDKHILLFLRVLHKNKIPVIVMSSEVNINVAKKALAEGACFFLQKPISLEDLKNVWQHVYRKVRNPRKDTHKPNCAKKIDEAGDVLRPPTGGIRIHEVGGVCRPTAVHDLRLDAQGTRSLRCKSGKVRRGEGNRQRELQYSRAKQQIATENHTKGTFGIKRPVDDKEEQEKAKKVKLNTEQTVSRSANKDEEGMENKDCNGSSEDRRRRTIWTPELHLKFTAALSALGDQRTSMFGVQGNPAQLMTPNSFTGFNDYRRQNLYSEHPVMSRNTNHQSESLYDFYLRTHGKFQNLDQIIETNSFTLGAGMNEIEKRNQPLGLEESRFKVSERTLLSTNYMTPEFASPYISVNTFQLPNASTSMNQAQSYCPASTAPFHAQNQNNFSAEVTGTTEVGMNQAELYTPAPTISINSHNQNHFFAEITGTTEVGMNQAHYYTPTPTTPINFQNQNHFPAEVTGTTELLEVGPEHIASANAETFPADFNGGSQQLDAAAREASPASSNNNQPMLEYDDLLKLLEEDPEEFNWFDSAPNAGDANGYCEWLTETLK